MEIGTCISINDNCTCKITGEMIGAGRYGRVFPATWLEHDVSVVIKIMHPETAQVEILNPKTGGMEGNGIIKNIQARRDAFKLEAQFLQDLQDVPWVVRYLADGISSGELPTHYSKLPVIVENMVNIKHGLNLLPNKEIKPEIAYSLCAQFCAMLGYAHDLDIVYRDIKKEHLIWDSNNLTVIDWNVSRKRGDDGADPANDFKRFFDETKNLLPPVIRQIVNPDSCPNYNAWQILWNLNALAKKEKWVFPQFVPDQPLLAKRIGKYALAQKRYEEAWDWFDQADPRDLEVQQLSSSAQQGLTLGIKNRDGL